MNEDKVPTCPTCGGLWVFVEEAMCSVARTLHRTVNDDGDLTLEMSKQWEWSPIPGTENAYYSYWQCQNGHKLEDIEDPDLHDDLEEILAEYE